MDNYDFLTKGGTVPVTVTTETKGSQNFVYANYEDKVELCGYWEAVSYNHKGHFIGKTVIRCFTADLTGAFSDAGEVPFTKGELETVSVSLASLGLKRRQYQSQLLEKVAQEMKKN